MNHHEKAICSYLHVFPAGAMCGLFTFYRIFLRMFPLSFNITKCQELWVTPFGKVCRIKNLKSPPEIPDGVY